MTHNNNQSSNFDDKNKSQAGFRNEGGQSDSSSGNTGNESEGSSSAGNAGSSEDAE